MPDLLTLIIAILACYRLAVLLSEDAGPMRMFSKFRSFLKREAKQHPALRKSDLHRGVDCLRCSSLWVAAPVSAYVLFRNDLPTWLLTTGDIFLLCMALSAGSILCHRMFPKR